MKIRSILKYLFPVMLVILVGGLILSRVFSPDDLPRPTLQITAAEAAEYVGEQAEVCGRVASADYRADIGGEPTFLNFERPHPEQLFTVVIWGENRHRWERPPEQYYADRHICASGTIRLHNETPQMEIRRPEDIRNRSQESGDRSQ